MKRFSVSDRDKSMAQTVSFHDVPMPRGLAFAIRHIEAHGGVVSIFSADRRDRTIAEHNRLFGSDLHGQAWLVAAHARDPGKYAAANSPSTTSHCFRSDGNIVYRNVNGHQIPSGGALPWYMCGIDLSDRGKVNDPSHFLRIARKLGYHFAQPYRAGSERHHVVTTRSPIGVLESANQISKYRDG